MFTGGNRLLRDNGVNSSTDLGAAVPNGESRALVPFRDESIALVKIQLLKLLASFDNSSRTLTVPM